MVIDEGHGLCREPATIQVMRRTPTPAPSILPSVEGILCGCAASLATLKTATARRPVPCRLVSFGPIPVNLTQRANLVIEMGDQEGVLVYNQNLERCKLSANRLPTTVFRG